MQNTGTGTYDYETYDVYGQAGVGAGAAAATGVAAAATYPPTNQADYQYPQQDYGYSSNQGHDYPQQDPGVPPVAGAVVAPMGLRDGMMARVQVGFNRTLEDELGESDLDSILASYTDHRSHRSWTAALATHCLR